MNHGEDLVNVVAKVSADVGVDLAKSTTETVKNFLLLLLQTAKERSNKLTIGEVNLEKMLSSGEAIKMCELKKQDMEQFAQKGMKYGITYTAIEEDGKELCSVLFPESNMERVQKVLESMLEDKVKEDNEKVKDLLKNEKQDLLEKKDEDKDKNKDKDKLKKTLEERREDVRPKIENQKMTEMTKGKDKIKERDNSR